MGPILFSWFEKRGARGVLGLSMGGWEDGAREDGVLVHGLTVHGFVSLGSGLASNRVSWVTRPRARIRFTGL